MVLFLVACLAVVGPFVSILIACGTFTCSRGSYFHRLSSRLKTLESSMEALEKLFQKIKETPHTPKQERCNTTWYEEVKKRMKEAAEKKKEASAEIEPKCIRFFCPKHCFCYDGLDAELSEMSKTLGELRQQGAVIDKEQQNMLPETETESKAMFFLPPVFDQIEYYVTNPSFQVISVCHPRDSGNLNKQINQKLNQKMTRDFLVVSVNVQNQEIIQVQEDIIRKLQLSDESRETESQDEKPLPICSYLGTKQLVLLLDGVSEQWGPSDLSRIVPLESKIIITAPTRSVIEKMKVDVCVEANILTEDVITRLMSNTQQVSKSFSEPEPLDMATLVGSSGIVAFPLQRTLAEPIRVEVARLATVADGPVTIWTASVNWVGRDTPAYLKQDRNLVQFADTQNRLKHSPF